MQLVIIAAAEGARAALAINKALLRVDAISNLGTCVTEEYRAEQCAHAQECRVTRPAVSAPAIGINP